MELDPVLAGDFEGGLDPHAFPNEEGIVDIQIIGETDELLHSDAPENSGEVQVFDIGPDLFPAQGP